MHDPQDSDVVNRRRYLLIFDIGSQVVRAGEERICVTEFISAGVDENGGKSPLLSPVPTRCYQEAAEISNDLRPFDPISRLMSWKAEHRSAKFQARAGSPAQARLLQCSLADPLVSNGDWLRISEPSPVE